MDKYVYFISDIHLGLEDASSERKKERALVALLHDITNKASALYIVGDLFDYWFEYRRVYQKGYFRTLTALQDMVEAGVEVHYIIGNHDFMHRDFFSREIGLKVHQDGVNTTIRNKKFFIAHGDGLVANDLGYRILKKILRSPLLQSLYSFVHPDLGIALASHSSKTSRQYTASKDYGEQDSMFLAAKKYLDAGDDFVVFGHSHIQTIKTYNSGTYINLGTWLDRPYYGVFNGETMTILEWNTDGK